ncbi:MAG: hypothetical protein WC976_06100 [Caldisericia bacterium]
MKKVEHNKNKIKTCREDFSISFNSLNGDIIVGASGEFSKDRLVLFKRDKSFSYGFASKIIIYPSYPRGIPVTKIKFEGFASRKEYLEEK